MRIPPSSNHPGGVNICFAEGRSGSSRTRPLPDLVGNRDAQRPGSPELGYVLNCVMALAGVEAALGRFDAADARSRKLAAAKAFGEDALGVRRRAVNLSD